MLRQVIDINPVEPVRIGFRQARGAKFSCMFQFQLPETIEGQAAGPVALSAVTQNPQIIFRPKTKGGAHGYDLTVVDAVAGTARVDIDGAFFNDPNGYIVEMYTRDEAGHPTQLIAHGEMQLTGGAYAYEGPLGPMTLPVPAPGEMGPVGPAGPAGADSTVPGPAGQRGTMWFTGTGPPVGGVNYIEGDMYLDQGNGDVWRFDASVGSWVTT